MKREKRRVRLAKRQAMLADAGQRAAMRGLADALAQEHRSAALAQRSRALLQANQGRSLAGQGEALSHAVAFTGALASLANDAEAAKADGMDPRDVTRQLIDSNQAAARAAYAVASTWSTCQATRQATWAATDSRKPGGGGSGLSLVLRRCSTSSWGEW